MMINKINYFNQTQNNFKYRYRTICELIKGFVLLSELYAPERENIKCLCYMHALTNWDGHFYRKNL